MVTRLKQLSVVITALLLSDTYLTLAQQQTPAAACRPIADVIFLLDGSDSISEHEFSQQLNFIKQFVQLSDISPESVRVGLTVVSSTIGDEFPLSLNSTKENLLLVLNSINQPQEGSRTDLGLVEMEQLFNRHARRGVLRIGVVLTDGRAKYLRATEGEARVIKDAGVFLIAVGVGRLIKFTELERMASTSSNAYNLEPIETSTKYLAETVTLLGQEACTGHNLVNQLNLKPPAKLPGSTIANNQDQTLPNLTPTLTSVQELQTVYQPPNANVMQPSPTNNASPIAGPSKINIGNIGEIFSGSIPSATLEGLSPMLSSSASAVDTAAAVEPTVDASQIGLEYISGNLRGQGKPVKPLADISSNLNLVSGNLPSQAGLAVAIPVADQLMINLNSVNGNLQSGPSNPSIPLADLSHINLQFANRNNPLAKSNHMVSLLKQNSLMSFRNNFDVKMEPFVAVDTIKSKIVNQQSPVPSDIPQQTIPDTNTSLDMLGSLDITKEQVPYNVPLDNSQRPLTRFAAPQLVYTPAPPVIVETAAPATQHIPVTTPKMPATTPTTVTPNIKPQPVVVQYQEKSPSPRETADMIIQSLIANKDLTNRILADTNPANIVNGVPSVLPTQSAGADSVPNIGLGINIPGQSVAETLAFLKQEMKPARTVEEHMNPIFQMFDATGPAQNNWRTQAATVQPATTTTLSPRESYMRAEMIALRDHCANGRYVDGISYISKPGTCSDFLQCYKEGNELKVRVARCPFETFFDDVHSVCRHHTEQACWSDPCVDNTIASYAHLGNCRAYWNCEHGQSRPVCCPSGTSYAPGFGCVRNATCLDTCMDFGNLNEVTHASKCKLLSMDADPHFYFEHVAGMGWMVRMCALGSQFDQILCKCQGVNEVVTDVCKPELYMDFQGGLVDVSGNNLAMGIYNVELDGGTGAFIGKSHLKLWRFSGMSLGQHVTISFRFRTSVTAKKGRLMHIVSNCCYSCAGEPQPSLDIAIIPADKGGVAVFSTTTREAGEIFLFVPFKDTFTGWNNLEYRYDGLTMRGTVNEQSAQKSIVGNILGKSEPLLIGSCGQTNAYDGFLDEFKFYMCNP